MNISAIFLIILLGLPVFFFWRWVFRKRIAVKRKRLITIWIVTILTAPILYAIVILMFFGIAEYYPNRDFDRQAWLADSDRRYEYTHDLISSKILIGKSKAEVMQILGKTDTTQTDELYYYIGYRPEITGIDPSSIHVNFKNGRVYEVFENDR